MNMPLHRISVIPARDVTFSKVNKSKVKGKEQTGSSATVSAPHSFSQTSVTPTSQDICSSSAVYSECCHHSPVQSAVVLKNPVCQNSLTQGSTVTVICQDMVQASKKDLHEHDCVHGLKAKNGKTTQALKFSKSLSDMDQKAQSTTQSFSYVERTCSEGKLTQTQEQCLNLNTFYHKEKKTFSLRPFTFSNSKLYFQSLSTNYSSTTGASAIHSAVHIPLLEDKCDNEMSRRKKLLHCLFSFSRSTSACIQELDNYSSFLQPEKSSSVMIESTGFCSDDMGDDDVFEDSSSVRLKITDLRAPLCSVEKDSDLDCPSLLSENFSPLSPVSVSGDACRLVYKEPQFSVSAPPPRIPGDGDLLCTLCFTLACLFALMHSV